MALLTVSARTWLPIASFATRNEAIRGTPAPMSVPNIRQNRTSANRAMPVPNNGKRSTSVATVRRPSSLLSMR